MFSFCQALKMNTKSTMRNTATSLLSLNLKCLCNVVHFEQRNHLECCHGNKADYLPLLVQFKFSAAFCNSNCYVSLLLTGIESRRFSSHVLKVFNKGDFKCNKACITNIGKKVSATKLLKYLPNWKRQNKNEAGLPWDEELRLCGALPDSFPHAASAWPLVDAFESSQGLLLCRFGLEVEERGELRFSAPAFCSPHSVRYHLHHRGALL